MLCRYRRLLCIYVCTVVLVTSMCILFLLFVGPHYVWRKNMVQLEITSPSKRWDFREFHKKINTNYVQDLLHSAEYYRKEEQLDRNVRVIRHQELRDQASTASILDEFKQRSYASRPCNKNSNNAHILILTPAKNMDHGRIETYFRNMVNFTYNHCQIRIVIGINKDQQWSIDLLKVYVKAFQHKFYSVEVLALNFTSNLYIEQEKHNKMIQLIRRSHLARVRNYLLSSSLKNETWVLWIDSDVTVLPGGLIETLLSTKKQIIVPSCMSESPNGAIDVYDRNTWQETPESLAYLKNKPAEFLMLEGYGIDLRKNIAQLQSDGDIVPIDGVGGCCLLVHANVHRKGAIFPDFVFKHHIETEGFAKLAQSMGYSMYGMPKYYVFH